MLICKKVTSDFVVAVSVDKVAERVDKTVLANSPVLTNGILLLLSSCMLAADCLPLFF